MKKLLLCSAALFALAGSAAAADLPVVTKAPPVPYAAAYNWTGFYVGGHLGGAWIDEDATLLAVTGPLLNPLGTVISGDRNGFLGGLQLGYNYQMQNWVVGVAGDFSWAHITANAVTASTLIPLAVTNTQAVTHWYSTLTGRLGYTWNNWLLYAKGGAAWTNEQYGGSATVGGVTVTTNTITDTRSGWTIGGGLEWALWQKWSAFAEYDYLDFGTKNYTFTAIGGINSTSALRTNVGMVKAGLNYRF